MSGPKHLWSGDWQRESEAASASHAHRAPTSAEPRVAEPAAETRPSRSRRRPRLTGTGLIVAAVVLVLAGVAFGLSSLVGSSGPKPRDGQPGPVASATTPTVPTVPTPTQPAVPTSPMPVAPPPPQTQTTGPTQTTPQTAPVANTPMVNWLGMQIATQPPGVAVVQTVAIGTPSDRAGINPGEIIEAVDGHVIRSARDILTMVKGMARGAQVTLQLAYGSGTSQAELTLGAPPSVAP